MPLLQAETGLSGSSSCRALPEKPQRQTQAVKKGPFHHCMGIQGTWMILSRSPWPSSRRWAGLDALRMASPNRGAPQVGLPSGMPGCAVCDVLCECAERRYLDWPVRPEEIERRPEGKRAAACQQARLRDGHIMQLVRNLYSYVDKIKACDP